MTAKTRPINQRPLLDGFHHRRRHQVEFAQGSRGHFGSSCSGLVSITGNVAPEPEFLELRWLGRNFLSSRNVGGSCSLAQLQRADIGNDRPAVSRRNLRRVVGHGSEAVGDYIEKVSERRFAQTLNVIRRRLAREATRRNHAVAIAHARVTGSAVNVVTLLSAGEKFRGDWKGHVVSGIVAQLSRVEISVIVQLPAGDRALDRRARRAQVGVEIALRERLEARLVVHVLTASGENQKTQASEDASKPSGLQ